MVPKLQPQSSTWQQNIKSQNVKSSQSSNDQCVNNEVKKRKGIVSKCKVKEKKRESGSQGPKHQIPPV